jgi:hypothetical protein
VELYGANALTRENGAGTDARGAVNLGEADAARSGDLPIAGLAAQLEHDLVHLPQTGRANRLAVGETTAIRVDRKAPADLGGADLDQGLLLAVLA